MNEQHDRFVPWPYPSPLLDAIDSVMTHPHDPLLAGFEVTDHKLNGRGFLHAGAIATVADVVIGHALARLAGSGARFVTVDLQCHLLGVARHRDWIDIDVAPTKFGGRLAAGSARFTCTDRVIATASALFVPAASTAGRTPPETS